MSEELDVLRDIARRLDLAGIPYMVTGSMAMSLHARPRMTRDIDVVIVLTVANVNALTAVLADVYYIDSDSARLAVRRYPHMFNVIHEQTIIKVDLIVKQNGDYANAAFARRLPFELSGQTINVIAPEDLIIAKLDWSRESHSEQQLNDVRALLRNERLDKVYLMKWVTTLGLSSIWGLVQA